MAKRTIYVVMGTTGEYSDRSEWPVLAIENKDAAEGYVSALDIRMQTMPQEWRDNRWDHRDDMKAHMAPLDPYFGMDYTGTSYFTYELELVDAADLPKAA